MAEGSVGAAWDAVCPWLLALWDMGQPGPLLLFHQQRPSSLQGLGSLGWLRVCGTHTFLGYVVLWECFTAGSVGGKLSCLGGVPAGKGYPRKGIAGAHSSARIALAVWVMRCGVSFGSDRRQWGWRGHGGR